MVKRLSETTIHGIFCPRGVRCFSEAFIPNLPNQIRGLYHWLGSCLRNSTRKSCEFHISHLISELSGACDQRLHHPSAQTYAEGDGFSGDGQAAVMIFLISAGWFGLVGKIEAGKQPSPTDICMFMGNFFGSIRVSCRLSPEKQP